MDQSLLDILACPKCRGELEILREQDKSGLACETCALVYPIEDEIPVLLIEEAVPRDGWPGKTSGAS